MKHRDRARSAALRAILDRLPPIGDTQSSPWVDLPVPPTVNEYWAAGRGRRIRKTKAGHDYARAAFNLAQRAGWAMITGPVKVEAAWYRREICTRGTCRDKISCGHKQPDVDGLIKPTLDALQRVAYADDNQVVEVHFWRIPLVGPTLPFVRVWVTAAPLVSYSQGAAPAPA